MAAKREVRGKPGPEPKGDRRQYTFRLPDEHFEHYKAVAKSYNVPLGDYLSEVLANCHGLPRPAYVERRARGQRMLPLEKTG